jgi:hypothetical protein
VKIASGLKEVRHADALKAGFIHCDILGVSNFGARTRAGQSKISLSETMVRCCVIAEAEIVCEKVDGIGAKGGIAGRLGARPDRLGEELTMKGSKITQ